MYPLPARARWRSALLLLGFVLFSLNGMRIHTCAGESNYLIRNWQTEDGLPQNSVNAVLQTRDGYLWLGTYNGLVRFDGIRFEIYDSSNIPELNNSRITALFEDASGRLWIGHETGDLTLLEAGKFRPVSTPKSNRGNMIASIGQDADGDIWLLDARGFLTRWRDGWSSPPVLDVSIAGSLIHFLKVSDRKLWFIRNGTLAFIEKGKPATVAFPNPNTTFVQAACASHAGGVWVLMDDAIRQWLNGVWMGESRPCPTAQAVVSAMLETSSGQVALGTQQQGLYLLNADVGVMQFSHDNGLSQNWVRSLGTDREGNLWVGTGNGGLDVIQPGKLFRIAPKDHWEGRAVLSVCADRKGGLWMGTEGAGLYHYQDGDWKNFREDAGLSNLFVWAVLETTNVPGVWVGTWGGGLFTVQSNLFRHAPGFEEMTTPVTALYQGRDGKIWVGTATGLASISNGVVNWYGREPGNVLSGIRAVIEDAAGSIWIGTSGGGLGRLKDGQLTRFQKRDGLANDFVQSLFADADGTLWIGTSGGGLSRYRKGKFATVGTRQGLPNNVICAIEDDHQGNFWMSSHGGLFRVARTELNRCADGATATVICQLYTKSDGLPTLECSGGFQPAAAKTDDGRIWFPTRKGLVAIIPEAIQNNALPSPVLIEEVRLDGRVAALPTNSAALIVQPGRGRVDIRYTGLCFTAPEKVRFKHRLDGLETEWEDAGDKRSASYSYLLPGNYTFRVMAANNDGVWNEVGAKLALVVLPKFWQTWWFRVICGFVATGAVVSIVLLITRRRMRRKMERLERQQALESERARIARDIHDDLGASLTRITMLSQSGHLEPDRPEAAAENLDQIYQTARNLTRAMDEIVWAVNPKHDTLDSLAEYLGKFAQDYLRASGVRCRLELPMQLRSSPLSADSRHNVFLAFKEVLNNVVKHSDASEVRISLASDEQGITLIVQDNGRGFDLADNLQPATSRDRLSHGNGLLNMRRRLEHVQGQCEILSTPGVGTTVRFFLPVNAGFFN